MLLQTDATSAHAPSRRLSTQGSLRDILDG